MVGMELVSNSSVVDPLTVVDDNLPSMQVEDYLATKMKLAQIMRDFNDKKLCFIGLDGSKIFVQQYHLISANVKQGDDIEQYLKGKTAAFVTNLDKKRKTVTETKLFIPDYDICPDMK
jgi:hypothetical protein